jgi:hypothetical protein
VALDLERFDYLDPGCRSLDGPTTTDTDLPYVVLFGSALGLEDERLRVLAVLWLAEQYRALFGGT